MSINSVSTMIPKNVSDLSSLNHKHFIEAIISGDLNEVKSFIASGADINKQEGGELNIYNEYTPLMHASDNGHHEIVELLLSTDGININFQDVANGVPELSIAIRRGHAAVVRALTSILVFNINLRTCNDYTYLNIAAEVGNIEIIRILLAIEGINVNIRGGMGYTPLILAASYGHIEVVKALLAVKNINVNLLNVHGESALLAAASKGHVEVVKVLLAAKDINVNLVKNIALIHIPIYRSYSQPEESSELLHELMDHSEPSQTNLIELARLLQTKSFLVKFSHDLSLYPRLIKKIRLLAKNSKFFFGNESNQYNKWTIQALKNVKNEWERQVKLENGLREFGLETPGFPLINTIMDIVIAFAV